MKETYFDVFDLLTSEDPKYPVYCIFPHVYEHSTRRFLDGFPGRTLFAVKANDHPDVLRQLYRNGVRHFDCASLPEIELVRRSVGTCTCYFMNPARIPGHAHGAQSRFGVRHFVVDHQLGLEALIDEIDPRGSVIFARMAATHASAAMNLSTKFGAPAEDVSDLLSAIQDAGAEAALAFNVGSAVTSPEAYASSMEAAREVLSELPFKVRLLDVGGGFPVAYPDYEVPPLERFFASIREARDELPLAAGGELMAEPGRALSAPGLSAITRVLLRKSDRLYLNDGLYGGFWELRFKAHLRHASRAFRGGSLLTGEQQLFRIFGPTCDASDEFPARVPLPADIGPDDHIEFGAVGAYSLSGRTDFNGFGEYDIVTLENRAAAPP